MSDRIVKEGLRIAFSSPGVLMSSFGPEGVARFRRLCDEALADTVLVTRHAGRDPLTDPRVGDVVEFRESGRHGSIKRRIVHALFKNESGDSMVHYGSDPWTHEREPKGRKTKLANWKTWCNDRRVTVLRYDFQPMPCRSVVNATEQYPAISCRADFMLASLIIAAYSDTVLATAEGNPYGYGLERAARWGGGRSCPACDQAEEDSVAVLPPDPEAARAVLRYRFGILMDYHWNSQHAHVTTRITDDAPHTAHEARIILEEAIRQAEHPEGWECVA
jgi:hypothetical protein